LNRLLERRFEQASKKVFDLLTRPSNADLLTLYALYKQATEGDVAGSKPYTGGMKEMAKWDAWKKLEGRHRDEAMNEYVQKVEELISG